MLSRINKLDRDFLYWRADLIICLPSEKSRDIAFIPPLLKEGLR